MTCFIFWHMTNKQLRVSAIFILHVIKHTLMELTNFSLFMKASSIMQSSCSLKSKRSCTMLLSFSGSNTILAPCFYSPQQKQFQSSPIHFLCFYFTHVKAVKFVPVTLRKVTRQRKPTTLTMFISSALKRLTCTSKTWYNIIYNITWIKRAFWLANWSFTICPWVHARWRQLTCGLTFWDCGKKNCRH